MRLLIGMALVFLVLEVVWKQRASLQNVAPIALIVGGIILGCFFPPVALLGILAGLLLLREIRKE